MIKKTSDILGGDYYYTHIRPSIEIVPHEYMHPTSGEVIIQQHPSVPGRITYICSYEHAYKLCFLNNKVEDEGIQCASSLVIQRVMQGVNRNIEKALLESKRNYLRLLGEQPSINKVVFENGSEIHFKDMEEILHTKAVAPYPSVIDEMGKAIEYWKEKEKLNKEAQEKWRLEHPDWDGIL